MNKGTGNSCSFRLGFKDDLSAIMKIVSSSIDEMQSKMANFQWEHGKYPTEYHFKIDIDNNDLWVCETNGEISGFAALTDDQSEYNEVWDTSIPALVPHRLAVDKRFQGCNIGFKILEFAEKIASEKGFDRIRIDTSSRNPKMQHIICNKLSYQFAKEIPFVEYPGQTFFCYEKLL